LHHVYCDPDPEERRSLNIKRPQDRELMWIDRIQPFSPNGTSIIFVCGADHSASFQSLLERSSLHARIHCQDWTEGKLAMHTPWDRKAGANCVSSENRRVARYIVTEVWLARLWQHDNAAPEVNGTSGAANLLFISFEAQQEEYDNDPSYDAAITDGSTVEMLIGFAVENLLKGLYVTTRNNVENVKDLNPHSPDDA
jgi:hypothetical protein